MSKRKQFEYCETIGVIAVHTQLQHMNENRPLSTPKNERYEYSIDRDWIPIKRINIHTNENTPILPPPKTHDRG